MSSNLEIGTIKIGTLFRVIGTITAIMTTIALTACGFVYQAISHEWHALRAEVIEIRDQQKKSTSPEEFARLRDKVDNMGERLIRIEGSLERGRTP